MISREQVIRELHAPTCAVCESPKVKKTAFDGGCWKLLPAAMQKKLYQKIGRGFEQAYEDAKRYLRMALRRREAVTSGEEEREDRTKYAQVSYKAR